MIPRHSVVDTSRIVLQENCLGHNPRTCHKLHNLIQTTKGSRPSATTRLVAKWDEPACTRAGAAVLVPSKRLLSLSSRTCITSCGLDSGGRQWGRHTYVCRIGRPGSSASKSLRSGLRRGREGSCCVTVWPQAACGCADVDRDGRAGAPGGHGRLVVAVAVPAHSSRGVAVSFVPTSPQNCVPA